MKNLKKILLSVLVMMMLLASVLVVAVGAQTETAPEIVSKNIAYKGNYALQLAISADSVKGGSVKVNVYDSADKTNKLGTFSSDKTENITTNVGELTVYVVTTGGVPAKDMGKILYFEAVDAENNTSALERYSVAEYFYERLYRAGVIEAVDEESEAKQYDSVRRDFYLDALDHGKKAQNLLINCNDDPADDITFFVTDYYYISYAGHNVEGSYDSALIGSTASLTLPDFSEPAFADKGYESWNVVKYNAETYEKSESVMKPGEELYIDGHTVVTPADPSAEVPADPFVPGQGQYYNNSELAGSRSDFETTSIYGSGAASGDTVSTETGKLVFTRGGTGDSYVQFTHNGFGAELGEPVFVYETDFMFTGYKANVEVGGRIGRFDFRANGLCAELFIYANAIDSNNVITAISLGELDLEADRWYNIRFEINYNENKIEYFCNGISVGTSDITSKANTSNKSCWYFETAQTAGTMNFDNMALVCYDKNPPVGGPFYRGDAVGTRIDGDALLNDLSVNKGNGAAMQDGALVVTGGSGVEAGWNYVAAEGVTTPIMVFEADMIIDATSSRAIHLYLNGNGKSIELNVQYWNQSGVQEHVYLAPNNSSSGGIDLARGQKYNVRFEVNYATMELKSYVDGVLKSTKTITSNVTDIDTTVQSVVLNAPNGAVTFDNVFIGMLEDGTN